MYEMVWSDYWQEFEPQGMENCPYTAITIGKAGTYTITFTATGAAEDVTLTDSITIEVKETPNVAAMLTGTKFASNAGVEITFTPDDTTEAVDGTLVIKQGEKTNNFSYVYADGVLTTTLTDDTLNLAIEVDYYNADIVELRLTENYELQLYCAYAEYIEYGYETSETLITDREEFEAAQVAKAINEALSGYWYTADEKYSLALYEEVTYTNGSGDVNTAAIFTMEVGSIAQDGTVTLNVSGISPPPSYQGIDFASEFENVTTMTLSADYSTLTVTTSEATLTFINPATIE